MNGSSDILINLIDSFASLPGIGKKSARRLAYHLINSDQKVSQKLADSILKAKNELGLCKECFNLSENDICPICASNDRDRETLCVVENFSDLLLIEKLNIHKGIYHVLGGVINPLEGVTPSSLKLTELFDRVSNGHFKEVIIGLNSSVEGDTTALYIADKLNGENLNVTRLASGIPVGGEIEYIDEVTLKYAFRDRKNI